MSRRPLVFAALGVVCAGALVACGGGGAAPPGASAAGANKAAGAEGAAADSVPAHPAAGAKAKPKLQHSMLPDSASPTDYRREVFRYAGGSRDPFQSLIASRGVGPLLSDLRLVSIAYDARYGNSVAVVRSAHDTRPMRLRRGDTIGQMRVIQIRQYEVVFQIEEFGFERQEVLALRRPEVSR
ncbi:MAG: hypothetical protein ABSB58_03195 [Gemmatimonadales bacterium]|jgi:hypothetical protein